MGRCGVGAAARSRRGDDRRHTAAGGGNAAHRRTARPPARAGDRIRASHLRRRGACRPSTRADLATLIRAAGMEADGQFVSPRPDARTGGNPLFVTELLRAMSSIGLGPWSVWRWRRPTFRSGSPTSCCTAWGACRPPSPTLLATAAVVGAAGDIATLAGSASTWRSSRRSTSSTRHVPPTCSDAAPPGRWQFRHQLIRDAVYASMTASDRVRRHARALEALAADPSTTACCDRPPRAGGSAALRRRPCGRAGGPCR